MGVFQSRFRACGLGVGCGWFWAVALVVFWPVRLCGGSLLAAEMRVERGTVSAWDAAVEARLAFEAEPETMRTRQEYARMMDGFRAIYHADPDDAHAARAVAQVAELLAEQGRTFGDKKSVHDAAGQYEYLAKAYPDGTMAPKALEQALALLGPEDMDEARRVKAELAGDYPRYVGESGSGSVSSVAAERKANAGISPLRSHEAANSGRDDGVGGEVVLTQRGVARTPGSESSDPGHPEPLGMPAVVTGIRHWSTASYTRVAIDLTVDPGEDVRYQAARVENPDRIFFDLQHARLAQPLVGKSFNVTDDGFLTRIRAAQFSGDVTRVVLDVHQVGEYSAFLLPNPYRLIIDIHGKQEVGNRKQEVASATADGSVVAGGGVMSGGGTTAGLSAAPSQERESSGREDRVEVAKEVGRGGRAEGGAVEVSSLPPMPVTDGSASFGLPVRSSDTAKTERVERPRVVISSKPTVTRPVPNTVTKSSADMGTEVAAVSEQPGKVEATHRPTSQPISSGIREQGLGFRGQGSGARALGSPRGSDAAGPMEGAVPTADGETSLTRALGLKIGRIVIDAGHGGHDSGTLGVGGIEEKDVVLDVALRLGKLLHDRLGAEVVYTRADDTFIPLETRTAIANKAQADLFISIHANSSQDASARGVEVYYLNFTSDPEAMTVASRENAVSTESVHELSDLVKKIALKDKIDESRELASDVDTSLYAGLRKGNAGLKDRGVKKAPFVVLIGANMPSILAEISFVTNPEDAAKLDTDAYRERVAESLYKGIARYAEGINGGRPRVRTVEQAER